jgi:antitoxin component of RelBE/YafQ-DinJ toxin-antitoxin module
MNETVLVRLTEKEKAKLQSYAKGLGVSMSEVIQDWIKALPEPSKPNVVEG